MVEMYNLKYADSGKNLKLFLINKKTSDALKYTPVYKNNGNPLNFDTIKILLYCLRIALVPYEKFYPKNREMKQYHAPQYPRGISGHVPSTYKPVIAVNPVVGHKSFVILHEVAHILLKHRDGIGDKDTKELEANLVAFMILNEFNNKDIMISIIRYFDLHLINIPLESCEKCIKIANRILSIIKEYLIQDFKDF